MDKSQISNRAEIRPILSQLKYSVLAGNMQ